MAKFTEKFKGGNQILTEFGGGVQSLIQKLATANQTVAKNGNELFKLTEQYESNEASIEEWADGMAEAFKESNVTFDEASRALNLLYSDGSITESTFKELSDAISILGNETSKAAEVINLSGVDIDSAYSVMEEAIGRVAGVSSDTSGVLTYLSTVLHSQKDAGENASNAYLSILSALEDLGIESTVFTEFMKTKFPDAFTGVTIDIDGTATALGNVGESAKNAAISFKDKLFSSIDTLGEKMGLSSESTKGLDDKLSLFGTAKALLKAAGFGILSTAVASIQESGNDASEGIDTLETSVEDFINATPNMNKTFRSLAEDVGIQFPEGMKKSLTDGLPEIERATKSLTDMIISTSENNLEIHSPSRVGWRITEYYLRGLANGIYENTSLLTNALNSLFSHFSSISNSMFGYGRDAGKAFADGFSSVHVPTPHMRISDWRLHNLPNGGRMQSPVFEVNWYKQGGLINGELWGMNESGNPEMVGKVGNGRTGVANNAIIAESIEAAVVRGMTQVLMNASFGNNDNRPIEMVVAIDGREVARAVNRANERTGYRMNP